MPLPFTFTNCVCNSAFVCRCLLTVTQSVMLKCNQLVLASILGTQLSRCFSVSFLYLFSDYNNIKCIFVLGSMFVAFVFGWI